ncbi:MAG: PAS domain S-box protein, partial [Burkholderiales bacterium]|nr:PAS domain S-box protein [Burkholderiales bacterium]
MAIPLPANEAQRIEALRSYEILDTPPDQALDDITQLAAQVCDAPIALITLVDTDRQWFKSRTGMPLAETAREFSFCAHAILHAEQVMIVPDLLADARFADNPLVTDDPKIRFYAGLPLVTADGYALGTLCIMDRVPRKLTADQLATLRALRRSVNSELALWRNAKELRRVNATLSALNATLEATVEERTRQSTEALAALRSHSADRDRAQASLSESEERFRILWETTTDAVLILGSDSVIRYANPAVQQVFGYAPEELTGQPLAMLQPERLRQAHQHGMANYVATGEKKLDWRAVEALALRRDGSEFPVEIAFSSPVLGGEQVFVGFLRDITVRRQAEHKIKRLNRVYAVLSGINSLIIRVRGRQELYDEACQIAVDQGGFDSAQIALLDQTTLEVAPVAWAGHEAEELRNVKATVREDVPEGHGTIGRAVRERRPVVVTDLLGEQDMVGEGRQNAIQRGFR